MADADGGGRDISGSRMTDTGPGILAVPTRRGGTGRITACLTGRGVPLDAGGVGGSRRGTWRMTACLTLLAGGGRILENTDGGGLRTWAAARVLGTCPAGSGRILPA